MSEKFESIYNSVITRKFKLKNVLKRHGIIRQ